MVQSLRNQWLSQFACTKTAAVFGRRGAFSWCKAYAINGFPGLLAPRPPPFSGGAAHFLGAKPTQSMAFPACLHQVTRRFRAARRIFLVQSRRNQWLSRLAYTKSAAGFRRGGAFSWCKADVINGFFPVCLHQGRRRFRAGRRQFRPVGTGRDASYFFRGFPFALVRFRNSCLRFPASSLRFRFAVFGFITEKPKKPRGSFLRA